METLPPEFRQLRTDDKLSYGCLMGFGIQLGTFFLLLFMANRSFFVLMNFWIWGIVQTLGILPLAFYQRSKGKRRVVQGLILTACLGVLLCSACAALFFPARFS